MIDEKKYFDEVNKLVSRGADEKDFALLLKIALGEDISVDKKYLTNKILNNLFNNGYTQDTLIPLSFLDETEVGKAIGRVKFYMSEDKKYRIKDVCSMTGYSRQYISEEIANGNIVCEREGKRVYFTESELNKYLEKKGFETLELKNELNYKEVREEFKYPEFEREEEYD